MLNEEIMGTANAAPVTNFFTNPRRLGSTRLAISSNGSSPTSPSLASPAVLGQHPTGCSGVDA